MPTVQTHAIKPAPYAYSGLVFGFDPLKITDAKHIIAHPEDFTPARRALAFRTVKQARGETVSPDIIRDAFGIQIGGAA
ncbi:MAG: hypothetical protein ACSHX3_15875 [Litorimonas sp.]